MSLPVARRAKPLPGAAALVGAAGALGLLAACSFGGGGGGAQQTASNTPKKSVSPSAAVTYNPLSGPIEPASALPKSCSKILSDQDLTSAFGSPQVGDTSYGKYAPLPTIGRTGRVTCGFGISVDQSGNAGPPVVTVSVITYDMASRALSRVGVEVNSIVAKGATAQQILVNGHPATVLVVAGSPGAASSGAASASPSAPSAAASASAKSPATGLTDTELVMADGNRTFVITVPLNKVSGSDAVTVLTNVAALVYQHTLPPGSPAGASPTGSTSATPSPGPSAS